MAKSKRNVKQSKGKSKRRTRRVLKKNIKKRILGGLPLSTLTLAVFGALFGLAKEKGLVPEQTKEVGPSEQFDILNKIGDSDITELLKQEKPEVVGYDPELVWDNFEWSKFVNSKDTDLDYLEKMKAAKEEEKKIAAMEEAAEKGDKLDEAVSSEL